MLALRDSGYSSGNETCKDERRATAAVETQREAASVRLAASKAMLLLDSPQWATLVSNRSFKYLIEDATSDLAPLESD